MKKPTKKRNLYLVQFGMQDAPVSFPGVVFSKLSVARDTVDSMIKNGASRSQIHVYKAIEVDIFKSKKM